MTGDPIAASIEAGATALGLALAPDRLADLVAYLRLLQRWNRTYNLTAVATPEEMVVRHVLDSLALWPYLGGDRCLDVATGAGLPGLVLALAFPGPRWVLLDSNGKKVRFCRQAILELRAPGVEAVQARVEHFRPAEPFDLVTARAWTRLAGVLEGVLPLVRPGGRILVAKGRYPEDELREVGDPPGVVTVHRLRVPGLAAERHVVVVDRAPSAVP